MSDFQSQRLVAALRKPHRCQNCGGRLNKGEPAIRTTGVWEGDFFDQYNHPECDAAARSFARLTDSWGDEWIFLYDMPRDQYFNWLFNYHPVAAEYIDRPRFIAELERRGEP
jgi:hypothetical protein